MGEISYFINHCGACGGGIEFPAHGVGEQVQCPHCRRSITLVFPSGPDLDPTVQIDAFLKSSSCPTNRAELLLLSRFVLPTEPTNLPFAQHWKPVLGDDPADVLDRFVAQGFIQRAEIALVLQLRSSTDLKAMAKERGVSSSGTKATLAKRLVETDPEGMAQLVADKNYLACSPKGHIIVGKFQEADRRAKVRAEAECLEALKQGKLKEACFAVAAYEARQVFPRGVGIDWQQYDDEHDRRILEVIFRAQLPRHAGLGPDMMLNLRLAAGMLHLWGTNDPSPWLPCMDADDNHPNVAVETMMLLSHAQYKIRLDEIKDTGIARVRILGSGSADDCRMCKSHDGKIYSLAKVPVLPCEGCTCETGCRCVLIAAG